MAPAATKRRRGRGTRRRRRAGADGLRGGAPGTKRGAAPTQARRRAGAGPGTDPGTRPSPRRPRRPPKLTPTAATRPAKLRTPATRSAGEALRRQALSTTPGATPQARAPAGGLPRPPTAHVLVREASRCSSGTRRGHPGRAENGGTLPDAARGNGRLPTAPAWRSLQRGRTGTRENRADGVEVAAGPSPRGYSPGPENRGVSPKINNGLSHDWGAHGGHTTPKEPAALSARKPMTYLKTGKDPSTAHQRRSRGRRTRRREGRASGIPRGRRLTAGEAGALPSERPDPGHGRQHPREDAGPQALAPLPGDAHGAAAWGAAGRIVQNRPRPCRGS